MRLIKSPGLVLADQVLSSVRKLIVKQKYTMNGNQAYVVSFNKDKEQGYTICLHNYKARCSELFIAFAKCEGSDRVVVYIYSKRNEHFLPEDGNWFSTDYPSADHAAACIAIEIATFLT